MTDQSKAAIGEGVDVTVVLPCYNALPFLEQAITSACQNDRISLEVLVVNDGSKDDSLEVMRALEAKDSRIRVIDKQNQGYGATMNRGFDEARGTYLAILEPDDWVDPHMYDDLFEYAMSFGLETPPDIVKGPYTRVWMPETPQQRYYNCSYYGRVDPGKQPFRLVDVPRLIQHHPSIWSAIYRRDFIQGNKIRFKEVPGAGWVDNPFLIETLCRAETIVYLDKPYYRYREDLPTSSSALRANTLPIERWHDMADVLDRLGVDDEGIWKSFGVIAFRYASGLIRDGALEDEELKAYMASMFERLGRERILAIPNVAPKFKATALRMMGEEPPAISGASYRNALVKEFFYTWRTNGLPFALSRIKMFLDDRGIIKYASDPTRTRSASI